MQRETKLGIALIGVLLTVFCGLLAKRLSRPGRMTDADLPKPNVAVKQPIETVTPPAKPTTLFAAKSDNNRPPEFDANLDTRASLPPATANNDWQRSTTPNEFASPRVTETADAPPPLASPLPIADIGERYATTPPVDATATTSPTSIPTASPMTEPAPIETAAPEVSRLPLRGNTDSIAETHSVLPHRSAYADSAPPVDVAPPVSVPVEIPSPPKKPNDEVAAAPAADPFLARSAPATTSTPLANEPAVRILPEPSRLAAAPIVETANPPIADQWTARPSEPPVAIRPSEFAAQPTAGTSDAFPAYRNTASTPVAQPPRTTTNLNSSNSNYNNVRPSPASVAARSFAPISATVEPIAATSNAGASPRKSNREGQEYVIQPNDSYWVISEKAYGSGGFFKALIEHNRKYHKLPDEMTVGHTIYIPDEASLRRAYPDLCPKPRPQVASTQQRLVSASARMRGGSGRVYTVLEGDTLFEIARHELGKPGRWAEIYDLNRDVLGTDFDYIRPGTELILPDDGRGETARQPAGLFPR